MIEHIILLLQILLWPLCLGIVGLILLQGGAGDLSSAFGGGGALDSTLGVGASKKMAKVTGWMACFFFAFVLFLAIPNKGGLGSPATHDTGSGGGGNKPAAAVMSPTGDKPTDKTAPSAPATAPVAATSAPVLTPAIPASTPVIAVPQNAVNQAVQKVESIVAPVVAPIVAPVEAAPVVPAPVVPVEVKPADAAPAVKPAQ